MQVSRFVSQAGACRIVEATEEHAEGMAPFLRSIDQLECACMGHTALEALQQGLKSDDATLTVLDPFGVPFAMFGVGVQLDTPYIWMLATDDVKNNAYDFVKHSRKWIGILSKPYGAVMNYVHESNEDSIKWLKFCGAVFTRKLTFNQEPFLEFVIPHN